MECKHQHTPPARDFKQHLRRVLCLTRLHRALFTQRIYCFLLLAMGSVVLQGCSNYTLEWKEEVKLSDDSVIVVERKAHRKPGGFPDSMRGVYFGADLSYAPQGIHWQDQFGIYSDPISFDRVDEVFYLVRIAENITACANKKPEAYGIQILKWANGQWLEIPQAAAPLDRIRRNLETAPWKFSAEGDVKGLLRLNGEDDKIEDPYNWGGWSNRTNPETLQSYYENSALDPRTQQRWSDEDQYRANFHLCGYWHRRVPVATSMEEIDQRVKARLEAEKRNKQLEAERQKNNGNNLTNSANNTETNTENNTPSQDR